MSNAIKVSSEGRLKADVAELNHRTSGASARDIRRTIREPPEPTAIDPRKGVARTIDGENDALIGASRFRGFFVCFGKVAIENLSIDDCAAPRDR